MISLTCDGVTFVLEQSLKQDQVSVSGVSQQHAEYISLNMAVSLDTVPKTHKHWMCMFDRVTIEGTIASMESQWGALSG